ncbi:hypothetical protein CJ030_MR7G008201 [Morella rubra]|uniref:Uncharacterized protein n=1 Tax=Morella rubra TaxID=262757 RepID=A0A6A1V2D4_9ROSI|nr:hypothetical protein CJ030_MR7G008210 [Morella rubra]KAB1206883.1 hypothetical protein CJ030_MR7G008201 [Morella rubra]
MALAIFSGDSDKDLVRKKGKGGVTPFHYAVETGDVDVTTEFLKACPQSIIDFTNQRETALHLTLRNDNSVAFGRLKAWVRKATFARNRFRWLKKWLNWNDEDGKTVREIINSKRENGRAFRHPSFLQKYMIYANNEFSKIT